MTNASNIQWLEKQTKQFEEARFGATTIMLTAQNCVGSIAAAMSLELNYIIALGFCAAVNTLIILTMLII